MNYNELQDNKQRILIGSATVYLILAVSFAATIAYWVVLAGLENSTDLSMGWYVLLWLIVGVGAVAEIIKKVTLSTYRNTAIWLLATAISVITVMGTYAILNSTRQEQITRSSDAYQDGRALKQQGMADAAQYAHAAGYDLSALQLQLDDIVCQRAADCGGGRKISYANYLSQKTEVEQKIADAKGYQRAIGTAQMGSQSMDGVTGGHSSSNPLLSDAAELTGTSEKALTTTFYLAVTLLLEFAAFFIGGRVEELKRAMRYSERELQELKNKAMFGVTISELMGYTPPTLSEQRSNREPDQTTQARENDSTAEPKRSGWQVTPAVGAGVGIGSDGLSAGIGAGVMATPKASTNTQQKPEQSQTTSSEKQATVTKQELTNNEPEPKAKEEPKQAPEANTDAEKQPGKRMEGFGFRGKIIPTDDTTKAISALNAEAKHTQEPNTQHAAKQLTIGTSEAIRNTQENPRFLSARTQKHTKHTENTQEPNTRNTQEPDTLYNAWLRALKAGDFRATAKESRKFIQQQLAGNQQTEETATLLHCGKISKVFLIKASHQGHLTANPNKAKNQPRFLLTEESNNV